MINKWREKAIAAEILFWRQKQKHHMSLWVKMQKQTKLLITTATRERIKTFTSNVADSEKAYI